jgi:hypothetical protein
VGAYRRSTTHAATASLSFAGLQVVWIGRVGARNGPAQVRLDGELMDTVSTYSSTADVRRVLYIGQLADESSESVIEVRNAGTQNRPRVEIDAFLVLEPAS